MLTRTFVVAAAVAALLAAAGCSSPDDSSVQSTPQGTVKAFYEAIAFDDVSAACRLESPDIDWIKLGGSCSDVVTANYPPGQSTNFADVAVDASKVTIDGDTALVPAGAVTFGGAPGKDGNNHLVRIKDQWYLTLDPNTTTN